MGSDYFSSERRDMLPFVPRLPSYLDLGCGEGRFGALLKDRDPLCEVWGVEPSDAATTAEGRLDRVLRGLFPEAVDAVDRRFAGVICNDVLEHMIDPWSACGRIADLLEPGGTLVASIPNFRNFATLSTIAVGGRWDYVDAGVLDRTHLRFFTRRTMVEMIESAGFIVESVTGSWPLTTRKMYLLRQAARLFSPDLAREGEFRQYVIVARRR